MNKKLAFGVLAAGLMAVPSVALVSAQDEVTLTWRTRPDNQAEIDVYTAISAAVDEQLEGISLEYQAGGTETDGYQNTLITEFAAGAAPDVFWIPGSDLARFVGEGTVLNLADLAAADADFDASVFYPQQIEQLMFNPEDGSMEGALWGLPRDASAMALYYNQDLFDAAGVDNPTIQLENGEWNWDTFFETSAAISDLGGDTYGFGMSNWWGNWELFINAAGGSYFNEDRTACALNSPEVENALTFMRSLYESEVAVPYGSDVEAPFVAGQVGMFLNGRWATPNLLSQATFNWNVAEVPAGPAGQSNFLFWGAYVVNANTANPEAAWELVNALTSADVQSQVAALGANFPSRVGDEVLAAVNEAFPQLNNAAFTNAMANYAVPEAALWAGDFGAINWAEGGVESRITGVMNGTETPADFVATICDVVNAGF
jgi:multiple sugar transport system substrate-binding protein